MNEAETRAEHIDPALKAAGWGVVEGSRIRREYRGSKQPRSCSRRECFSPAVLFWPGYMEFDSAAAQT